MIPPISGAVGPLGPAEWNIQPLVAPSATQGVTDPNAVTGAAGSSSGGFGGALANAINSLEQGQANATTAAQQLATGQATDPTQAVTAVENASLEMQFASQLRTKFDEAATTIFQTAV